MRDDLGRPPGRKRPFTIRPQNLRATFYDSASEFTGFFLFFILSQPPYDCKHFFTGIFLFSALDPERSEGYNRFPCPSPFLGGTLFVVLKDRLCSCLVYPLGLWSVKVFLFASLVSVAISLPTGPAGCQGLI